MPVSVPDTLASPELACRCDAPRPQDSVQTRVVTGSGADRGADVPGTAPATAAAAPSPEIDGPGGLEPTRYGDWERRGRCIDF